MEALVQDPDEATTALALQVSGPLEGAVLPAVPQLPRRAVPPDGLVVELIAEVQDLRAVLTRLGRLPIHRHVDGDYVSASDWLAALQGQEPAILAAGPPIDSCPLVFAPAEPVFDLDTSFRWGA